MQNTQTTSKLLSHVYTRDLRAKLEYALDKLLDVCCTTDARTLDDQMAEGKDEIPTDTEFLVRSPEVTAIVRKELAVAIRDLMHHGLGQVLDRIATCI